MPLTDVEIRKAKPGEKRRILTDGGGMYMQIETTGGKLWRYQYRFEGKRKLKDCAGKRHTAVCLKKMTIA